MSFVRFVEFSSILRRFWISNWHNSYQLTCSWRCFRRCHSSMHLSLRKTHQAILPIFSLLHWSQLAHFSGQSYCQRLWWLHLDLPGLWYFTPIAWRFGSFFLLWYHKPQVLQKLFDNGWVFEWVRRSDGTILFLASFIKADIYLCPISVFWCVCRPPSWPSWLQTTPRSWVRYSLMPDQLPSRIYAPNWSFQHWRLLPGLLHWSRTTFIELVIDFVHEL